MEQYCGYYDTPIGILKVVTNKNSILSALFVDTKTEEETPEGVSEILDQGLHQIDQYFQGYLQSFHSLPLQIAGSDFQVKIWDATSAIPFGETSTYQGVAEASGHPKAARAVGNALNKNKILLFVPCHRILPADGSIGGFGAGSWRKDWLLKHEAENCS